MRHTGDPHKHCWSPARSHCGPVPLKYTSPKSFFPLSASALWQEQHCWGKKGKETVCFILRRLTSSTGTTLPHYVLCCQGNTLQIKEFRFATPSGIIKIVFLLSVPSQSAFNVSTIYFYIYSSPLLPLCHYFYFPNSFHTVNCMLNYRMIQAQYSN